MADDKITSLVRLRRHQVVARVMSALHASTCGCRGFIGEHAQEYWAAAEVAVDALAPPLHGGQQ